MARTMRAFVMERSGQAGSPDEPLSGAGPDDAITETTRTLITEGRRSEEALTEADRRKDEFLATVAHELRNLLAPIRHAVRALEVRGPTDPEST